jgi:predicted outer membrane lipoprotein
MCVCSSTFAAGAAAGTLLGLISGFSAFALFCFALAVALRRLDRAAAFALATALALMHAGPRDREAAQLARGHDEYGCVTGSNMVKAGVP